MVEAQQRNLAGRCRNDSNKCFEQERRKRDTKRCLIKNKQSWRVQLPLLQISARLSMRLLRHGKLNRREKRKKRNAKQKQQRRQSAIDVRNMNVAKQCCFTSLRLLSKGPRSPGPTAQQSKANTQRRGAKTTTAACGWVRKRAPPAPTSLPEMDSTNAQTRYEQLRSDRDYYLDRARACSRLTLPYLIPTNTEPTPGSKETYPVPWNGIGARGVGNLASRILLASTASNAAIFSFLAGRRRVGETRRRPRREKWS